MVFRYILAWGLINYCDLKPHARKTIEKYLQAFQKSFAKQFAMADKIKKLILKYDIFTPHGHRKTIEAVVKLWHLDALVELQTS